MNESMRSKLSYTLMDPSGLFVFDLLNANEVPDGEPFETDFDGGMKVRFSVDKSNALTYNYYI